MKHPLLPYPLDRAPDISHFAVPTTDEVEI